MLSENKSIILYPRTYNRRGDESLHSVEGLTHDGHLVNIKLRIQGTVKVSEALPSISRFAKTDIRESKLSCLATEDNGPDNPAGILIFTDCEIDPNNRKNITAYISRWAHILRNGHSVGPARRSDLPFIGVGRLAIDKNTREIKEAHENIRLLEAEKPREWEEGIARNRETILDHRSFDYYLHGYLIEEERPFAIDDLASIHAFMQAHIEGFGSGSDAGFMFRLMDADDELVPHIYAELFPLYVRRLKRLQRPEEILEHFSKANPELAGLRDSQLLVMPMVRYAGRKIFKDSINNKSAFEKLEQTYYIDNQPVLFPMAVKTDRLDNGQLLINRIHLIGSSLGSPFHIGFELPQEEAPLSSPQIGESVFVLESGLQEMAWPGLCSWYQPSPMSLPHNLPNDNLEDETTLIQGDTSDRKEIPSETPYLAEIVGDDVATEKDRLLADSSAQPQYGQTEDTQVTSIRDGLTEDLEATEIHYEGIILPGKEDAAPAKQCTASPGRPQEAVDDHVSDKPHISDEEPFNEPSNSPGTVNLHDDDDLFSDIDVDIDDTQDNGESVFGIHREEVLARSRIVDSLILEVQQTAVQIDSTHHQANESLAESDPVAIESHWTDSDDVDTGKAKEDTSVGDTVNQDQVNQMLDELELDIEDEPDSPEHRTADKSSMDYVQDPDADDADAWINPQETGESDSDTEPSESIHTESIAPLTDKPESEGLKQPEKKEARRRGGLSSFIKKRNIL